MFEASWLGMGAQGISCVLLRQVDGACRGKQHRRQSAGVPMDESSGGTTDDSFWGRRPSSIAGQGPKELMAYTSTTFTCSSYCVMSLVHVLAPDGFEAILQLRPRAEDACCFRIV